MLCCSDGAEATQHKRINSMLRGEKKKLESEVKLLLLGAGESGKSTIAKQMKILHLQGFSIKEREQIKIIIFNNIIGSIRALILASSEFKLTLEERNQDSAKRLDAIGDVYFGERYLSEQHVGDIIKVWNDPAIQETYKRSSEFQLSDSAAYYFNKIEEIGAPNYVPNEQDILRSRAKTMGVVEIEFDAGDMHFRMVDVGGQRSARKKWIHCFQDVTAVIFCVALSEYDLKLFEDEETNRMHESLGLFKEMCNLTWFKNTAMILFLNKRDLYEEKIKRVPLSLCFADYTGPNDIDSTIKYIQLQFEAQNTTYPKKPIYAHTTTATDTENINRVFTAVKDSVLRRALDEAGIV